MPPSCCGFAGGGDRWRQLGLLACVLSGNFVTVPIVEFRGLQGGALKAAAIFAMVLMSCFSEKEKEKCAYKTL